MCLGWPFWSGTLKTYDATGWSSAALQASPSGFRAELAATPCGELISEAQGLARAGRFMAVSYPGTRSQCRQTETLGRSLFPAG